MLEILLPPPSPSNGVWNKPKQNNKKTYCLFSQPLRLASAAWWTCASHDRFLSHHNRTTLLKVKLATASRVQISIHLNEEDTALKCRLRVHFATESERQQKSNWHLALGAWYIPPTARHPFFRKANCVQTRPNVTRNHTPHTGQETLSSSL